ncbi:hypothetical protein J6Z61_004718 [Salmonella enterica subsp. enterica serovar Newport]|nr:hypothetical protein [Salmonella enterica subsp. enterica serovar Newport]
MKRVNTSLTKTGILFSLVLLSPGVMAAENLNFNYTRAGALSLDPRLSLQAKACHSKGDPMVVNFRVGDILAGSGSYDGLEIRLKARGEAYEKSFDVFSAPGSSSRRMGLTARNTGTDFQVPWSVSASGIVSGTNGVIVGKYPIPERVSYGDPFCFSEREPSITPNINTHGWVPIYRDDPKAPVPGVANLFEEACRGKGSGMTGFVSEEEGKNRYWPSVSNSNQAYPAPAPDYIQKIFDKEGGGITGNFYPYQHSTLFFRTKYVVPAVPANPYFQPDRVDADFDDAAVDRISSVAPDTYIVPLSTKDNVSTQLSNANVSVILGNRNISSLSLILLLRKDGRTEKSYTFDWVRSSADSNVMQLQGKSGNLNIKAGKNDGNTDPYAAHQFYTPAASGFFKGTLVNGGGLDQAYKDYVNKIMPLSLPSDMTGNINLVNTDSLTVTIKRGDETVSNIDLGRASYIVRITGQPLKFAPLKVNGKVAVSAMQIRNACY